MTAQEALKNCFGYSSFRPGQEQAVNALLEGRDLLAVMPTGAGKSLCYQLPALLLPGVTLVVSPLISLMQDQVKSLKAAGVSAAYVNSSLTEAQIAHALALAAEGAYKILYAAPERLESGSFLRFARSAEISLLIVDEAHCISQWGQDFRPSYRRITDFASSLPCRVPVGAFTATATEQVSRDIRESLRLRDPVTVSTGFDRENLRFSVERRKGREKDRFAAEYVSDRRNDSGIVYCATRKNVDSVWALLKKQGVRAARYHAGMESEDRRQSQEDFIYDRVSVIVATNAFGMGIDKSDVRYVLHYNMPQSMENYYQEAGRAGRDGLPSECVLLFSEQDIQTQRRLLELKDYAEFTPDEAEELRRQDTRRLRVMEDYCRTEECLRHTILSYFGERSPLRCGNCGSCLSSLPETDRTREAITAVRCVRELGGRYGRSMVSAVLRGSTGKRVRELGLDRCSTFGALSAFTEQQLRELLAKLERMGCLRQTEGEYPMEKTGSEADALLRGELSVTLRELPGKAQSSRRTRPDPAAADEDTQRLFALLKGERTAIAREEGVPAYVVFDNRTLLAMAEAKPTDTAALAGLPGLGQVKLRRYGERFVRRVREFLREQEEAYIPDPEPDWEDYTDAPGWEEFPVRDTEEPYPEVDPDTGELLSEPPEQWEAETLTVFAPYGRTLRRGRPSMALWDGGEDEALRKGFAEGRSAAELSGQLHRTRGEVRTRLRSLGLLPFPGE